MSNIMNPLYFTDDCYNIQMCIYVQCYGYTFKSVSPGTNTYSDLYLKLKIKVHAGFNIYSIH